ncbi:MAG: hypothetical protein WAU84_03715, partial [Thermoguttaceae bacterium]
MWAFIPFVGLCPSFARFGLRNDVPFFRSVAAFAEEVVKKWGQAPRWMPFSRGLPDLARSQSPFFHNL